MGEDGSSCSDTEDKQEHVNGIIANNGRLRRCARDFWHVVGWAFNCSVRYPRRWTVWKVWLDYMLDVLEHDWTQREQEDLAEEDCWNLRRQSLIVKYLADAVDKSYAMKRIVRSAFADANAESLKDFPEIFPNETKKLSYGQKRKEMTRWARCSDLTTTRMKQNLNRTALPNPPKMVTRTRLCQGRTGSETWILWHFGSELLCW